MNSTLIQPIAHPIRKKSLKTFTGIIRATIPLPGIFSLIQFDLEAQPLDNLPFIAYTLHMMLKLGCTSHNSTVDVNIPRSYTFEEEPDRRIIVLDELTIFAITPPQKGHRWDMDPTTVAIRQSPSRECTLTGTKIKIDPLAWYVFKK